MMQNNYLFKARCSKIHDIMTDPVGKSNIDKYNDLQAAITKNIERHDGYKDGLITKQKLSQKILEQRQQLLDLEPIKNTRDLSSTCKSYVDAFMKGEIWERKKRLYGKAIKKGNTKEDESIMNIGIVHELGILEKHVGRVDNGWLQGECDIKIDSRSLVIDAKTSWNLSTFPMYKREAEKAYIHQVKGYMELYNLDYGWVCYVLTDAPVYMVEEAINRELWEKRKDDPGLKELTPEDRMFIIKDMVFTYDAYIDVCQALNIDRDGSFLDIPLERRVKTFKYERDDDFMDSVKDRVGEINEYIHTNPEFKEDLIIWNKRQANERIN